ncbi:cell division protein ZapA [Candidatus Pelagibacter communis]|uniref:cell division protein ZapA n=1 Tax=Pelagibacter ubique TaxID=198252 RepID=UPI000A925944|nr:cell division protein ZapA [Candidatus Pelagibacter ubique]
MANVNIKFNGKEYLLSCEDGQEEHLEELSSNLSQKFSSLKNSLGNIGENKLLLITSITTMDEYFETKKKLERQKIEIQNLISKFKELKSLVYKYKDEKEKEILKLSDNQTKLEFEIQNQKNNYENLIDSATKEIENFIQKNNPDLNIQ